MAKKERKQTPKASKAWLETYGDMITLMLCFFVALFNPTEIDEIQLAQLTVALQGDPTSGGMSLSSGRLADLGFSGGMPLLSSSGSAADIGAIEVLFVLFAGNAYQSVRTVPGGRLVSVGRFVMPPGGAGEPAPPSSSSGILSPSGWVFSSVMTETLTTAADKN